VQDVTDPHALADALADRIGYRFRDESLLQRALSHRSASGRHNERLEFLGDSALNFVVSDDLYQRFPDAEEGVLTRLRARLVRRETLAAVARERDLGRLLRLGGGERKSGGRDRDSILADAMEAVFGAVYLDGGVDACRAAVGTVLADRLSEVSPEDGLKDAKTRLQEALQARGLSLPAYAVVRKSGADHDCAFTVECHVEGTVTVGTGTSRRRAEQDAAAKALAALVAGTTPDAVGG